MSNWLGSHWRWRGAMVCVAVAMLSYGWWQAGRWTERVLVNSSSSFAVYRTTHRDKSYSLEAYDWKTGRRWALARIGAETYPGEVEASVRVSPDGKTVVWRYDNEVHAVDIKAPDRRHVYPVPMENPRHYLIGLSHDARFGVFQAEGIRQALPDGISVTLLDGPRGTDPSVFVLTVVELASGRIVSSREWESHMGVAETFGVEEFKSNLRSKSPVDPMEPICGRWKLSDEGEWELLEQSQRFAFQYVHLLRESAGGWRIIDDLSKVAADADTAQTRVFGTFDLGKRFFAGTMGKPRAFSGNFETKQALEIEIDGDTTGGFVTRDGSCLVIGNRRDDFRVFALRTGKVIARDSAGSSRRHQLLAVGIGLLVLAAVWARVAIAESMLSWGMIDTLAAILLVEAAIFPIYQSFYNEFLRTVLPFDLFDLITSFVLRGAFVGAAILTGWYWAHGREWFPTRWLLGTLWLVGLAIPPVVYERRETIFYDMQAILRAWVIAGLVTSGLTAAVAVLFRPLGWNVRASEGSSQPWRFGVLQLILLTASVGIALVLVQSMFASLGLISLPGIFRWPSSSFFLGIPLVGILFFRSRWALMLGIVAVLLLALAATCWYVESLVVPFFGARLGAYLGEAIAAASTILAIVVPCLRLRRQGWRWTRTKPVVSSVGAAA